MKTSSVEIADELLSNIEEKRSRILEKQEKQRHKIDRYAKTMRKRFEGYRARLFASSEGSVDGSVGVNKAKKKKQKKGRGRENEEEERGEEKEEFAKVEADEAATATTTAATAAALDNPMNSPTLRAEMEKTRSKLLALTADQGSLPDGWEERISTSVSR